MKAVGNTLSKVRLPKNQELNARTIKHVAGNGPIYIRALKNIQSSQIERTEDEWVIIVNLTYTNTYYKVKFAFCQIPVTGTNYILYNFFFLFDLLQDSLSNEDSATESTHRKSEVIRDYIQPASSSSLAISNNEDANKACCSSASALFDFEIDQLKEMFPSCPPDILIEAKGRCCDMDSAVDFVMQHSSKIDSTVLYL